ncbi:MAG: hypothetical protein Q8O06_04595 [Acetobacterium sp.]|nr:hypothetical protein [Acetobacterium sp.]
MGKSYRYPREHGRRCRSDESPNSIYPDNDAYDDVMDIYADQLDASSEHYGFNEVDEDDI